MKPGYALIPVAVVLVWVGVKKGCDHGMLKPSRKLFDIAVEPFKVERSKIVYIGDSFERDVVGAKQSGLSAVWISYGKACPEDSLYRPDQIIDDLRDLRL